MKLYIPECDEPLLLVNKSAVNAIFHGAKLFMDGRPSTFINKSNIGSYSQKKLLEMAKDLTLAQLEDYFVVYPNGYKDYLFMLAPCGKCDLCRHRKQVELVFRAAMESACYDTPAYFFTLTYAPKYLPYHGELRYKDIQNFFKRLRIRWKRKGIEHNIRYMVAGEYGSDPKYSHRPHYHIILWNNPYKANELRPLEHKALKMDIFNAWDMCEIQSFDFGQCRGGAAQYASKYVAKMPNLYGHWTKTFIRCSCGHGGIGFPLIKQHIEYLRNSPYIRQLDFRDFNGKLLSVNFGSYVVGHVWPSPTMCVPASVKQKYKQYVDNLTYMVNLGLLSVDEANNLSELARPYKNVLVNRFCPRDVVYKPCVCHLKRLYYQRLFSVVNKELLDGLCEVNEVDNSYLEKYYKFKSFIPDKQEISLGQKRHNIRWRNALQLQRETL